MDKPRPAPPVLLRRASAFLSGIGGHALSFLAGLLVALVLYYVLYRMGLPSTPFIYVSF